MVRVKRPEMARQLPPAPLRSEAVTQLSREAQGPAGPREGPSCPGLSLEEESSVTPRNGGWAPILRAKHLYLQS